MISTPRLIDRPAQPYMAIRHQVRMDGFAPVIDESFPKVFAWLREHGVDPAAPPLIRYLFINMPEKLDVEIGVPVATEQAADDGPVRPGLLPAGRYATLVYTGPYTGLVGATAALLEWGAQQGLVWDKDDSDAGEEWGARFESYLTDPSSEPDQEKWQTDIFMRVEDSPAAGEPKHGATRS